MKGSPHSHRHGKTQQRREHHTAHKLKKTSKDVVKGFHDRFLNNSELRASQLEKVWVQLDEFGRKILTSFDASRILSIQKEELVDLSQ